MHIWKDSMDIGDIGGVFSNNRPLATNKESSCGGMNEYANHTNSEMLQLSYRL